MYAKSSKLSLDAFVRAPRIVIRVCVCLRVCMVLMRLFVGLQRIPRLSIPLCPLLTVPFGVIALMFATKDLCARRVASASRLSACRELAAPASLKHLCAAN